MIEERMMALRDDAQVAGLSRFFKACKGQYGEGDRFLGIKVPVTGTSRYFWDTWATRLREKQSFVTA